MNKRPEALPLAFHLVIEHHATHGAGAGTGGIGAQSDAAPLMASPSGSTGSSGGSGSHGDTMSPARLFYKDLRKTTVRNVS